MTLRFDDGMQFDTRGPLRPQRRCDGWYVVGRGLLIPVADRDEALAVVAEMTDAETPNGKDAR